MHASVSSFLIIIKISSWPVEKCARKWGYEVLFSADLVTSSQGNGQQKYYKMVKSMVLISMAGMKHWLNSLHVMFNVKFFEMQDLWMDGQW